MTNERQPLILLVTGARSAERHPKNQHARVWLYAMIQLNCHVSSAVTVIHGGCRTGADAWAEDTLLALWREHSPAFSHASALAVYPEGHWVINKDGRSQSGRWRSPPESMTWEGAYKPRNEEMVRMCLRRMDRGYKVLVLAILDHDSPTGGARYTADFAEKQGLTVNRYKLTKVYQEEEP